MSETRELRRLAEETRDLLANYLWNEDDSGDENDLVSAYDRLRDLLGPSTEESVGLTLAADPMLHTPRDGRHPDHGDCGQRPCPHIPLDRLAASDPGGEQ